MKQQKRQSRRDRVESNSTIPVYKKQISNTFGYSNFILTESQKEFANKIIENDMVVCSSPAGTGKSLTALHTFVRMYLQDQSKNITVVRTPVEAGFDKIGFLPADLNAKIEVHFASSHNILTKLLNKGKVETDKDHRIHLKIPNFMLGSTLDNTLLLIDEAQELPPLIMKLLLERVGENSKVVILGDPSQRYSGEKGRNGLNDVISKFFYTENDFIEPKFSGIEYHEFEIDDVQRSEFCKTVLRAYS